MIKEDVLQTDASPNRRRLNLWKPGMLLLSLGTLVPLFTPTACCL